MSHTMMLIAHVFNVLFIFTSSHPANDQVIPSPTTASTQRRSTILMIYLITWASIVWNHARPGWTIHEYLRVSTLVQSAPVTQVQFAPGILSEVITVIGQPDIDQGVTGVDATVLAHIHAAKARLAGLVVVGVQVVQLVDSIDAFVTVLVRVPIVPLAKTTQANGWPAAFVHSKTDHTLIPVIVVPSERVIVCSTNGSGIPASAAVSLSAAYMNQFHTNNRESNTRNFVTICCIIKNKI